MIAADKIRTYILELAGKRQSEVFTAEEVAKSLDLVDWNELMESVNLVAEVMVLQNLLEKRDEGYRLVQDTKVNTH